MNCLICDKELVFLQKKYCSQSCAGKAVGAIPTGRQATSDNDYLSDIRRVKDIVGHYPTYKEYYKHSKYPPASLQIRFGSWIKALQLAGYKTPIEPWSLNMITPEEGGWLAGFFAGEGTFGLSCTITPAGNERFEPSLSISQRNDNAKPILEIIRLWKLNPYLAHLRTSGGYTKKRSTYYCNPVITLTIRRTTIIHQRVIPTFMQYPMRSKKQDELLPFAQAITTLYNRLENGRFGLAHIPEELSSLRDAYIRLRTLRSYYPPAEELNWSKADRIKPFMHRIG